MKAAASIEIDIFSGRPNPRFELRGDKAERLRALLESSRDRWSGDHADMGLGFRGFLVRLGPEGAPVYRVRGDTVRRGDEAFHDPQRKAQAYILSVLPPAMKTLLAPILGPEAQDP